MALFFAKTTLVIGLVCLPVGSLAQEKPAVAGATVPPPPGPYISARDPLSQNGFNASLKQQINIQPRIVLPSTMADFPPANFDPEKPAGNVPTTVRPGAPSSEKKAVRKPEYAPLDTAVVPDQKKSQKELTAPENKKPSATGKSKSQSATYPPADTAKVPQNTPEPLDGQDPAVPGPSSKEVKKPAATYAPADTANVSEKQDESKNTTVKSDESGTAGSMKIMPQPRYAPKDAAQVPRDEVRPDKTGGSKLPKNGQADTMKQPLPVYAPTDTAVISERDKKLPKPTVQLPDANRYVPVAPAPGSSSQAYQRGYMPDQRQWGGYRQAYPNPYQPQARWRPRGYPQQPYRQMQPQRQPQAPSGYQYPAPSYWYPYQAPNFRAPQYAPQGPQRYAPQGHNHITNNKDKAA